MDTIHEEGWIKLYRKSADSQVFQSEGLWKTWTWCLLKASHKERWVQVKIGKGTTEVFVKRGQFIFGRKTAARVLRMPERTVYKRMLKLKTMGNCDIQSDTHYSIVTINNYDLYQSTEATEGTGEGTPKGQARDTNKNDKNEKNNKGRSFKKETDPRVKTFFDFWGKTFQAETGQPYSFTYEIEGKLTKQLLKDRSLDTLQDLARKFFRDQQVKEKVQQGKIGYTIGAFKVDVNRLVSLNAMDLLVQIKKEQRERAQD